LPLVALARFQPPEASHPVAFVLCQPSDVDSPAAIFAGLALMLTVGAGEPLATATDTDCEAEPPEPVQVRTNVVVAASGPTVSLPDNPRAPDHPPEAVQLAALVAVHCSVVLP
jgi:hypothetical protein